MEKFGKVQAVMDDGATVVLDGGEVPLRALNTAGAKAGDRVRLELSGEAGAGGLAYMVPLAGLLVGVVGGRLFATIEVVATTLEAVGGKFLGNILSSGDNLSLAGGMLGLAASMAGLSIWIKGKKAPGAAAAEVVEILDRD